jgi:hypothetical protein
LLAKEYQKELLGNHVAQYNECNEDRRFQVVVSSGTYGRISICGELYISRQVGFSNGHTGFSRYRINPFFHLAKTFSQLPSHHLFFNAVFNCNGGFHPDFHELV